MATTSKKKAVDHVQAIPLPGVKGVKRALKKDALAKKSPSIKPKTKENQTVFRSRKLFLREHEEAVPIHISIADNTKAIIPRSHLQLALLSPFRFPLPSEAFVAPLARTAGVFFVVVGAIFSLLNLNYATGIVATSMEPDSSTNSLASVYTTTGVPNSTSIVSPSPEIRISVSGGDAIKGITPVSVSVTGASGVLLLLKNIDDNHITTLGNTKRIDDGTWRYEWQTSHFENGTYRLTAVATLSGGTFNKVDERTYTIDNEIETVVDEDSLPDTEDTTTPHTSTSTATSDSDKSETQALTEEREVLLSVPEGTLSGSVSLVISVTNATEVKVYAQNVKNGNSNYVGTAKKVSDQEWSLQWKTLGVIDGAYYVKAKAKFSDESVESVPVRTTVQNAVRVSTIMTTVDIGTSTETEELVPEIEVDIADLKPSVSMKIFKEGVLSGIVPMYIESTPVDRIELYAVGKNSNTPFFLGSAHKLTEAEWKFSWSTDQQPNGAYYVYPRTKSSYGYYEGQRYAVYVENNVARTFTPEQEEVIDTFSKIPESLKVISDGAQIIENDSDVDTEETHIPSNLVYVESVESFVDSIGSDDMLEEQLLAFRKSLNEKQDDLARAIRANETEQAEIIKQEIELMRNMLIQDLPNSIEKKEIIDRVNGYLSQVTFQTVELTSNNEKLIRDRIGDMIFKDSDQDNVSDYDEINLYRTNPFSADTDSDGHIDGSEIVLGYNPHDSSSESIVVYESPRESGVAREDLLIIEDITTLPKEENEDKIPRDVQALIRGKALPNSFVTLFIYSTPVVVTVKTDAEGSWSYVLDKGLEEGDHEVYVGLTDNTGKIVAKSNPFSFVKTAEAYTATNVDTPILQTEESPEPTFFENRMLLLVASIAVVALGLVLILLGFHVRERRNEEPQSALV